MRGRPRPVVGCHAFGQECTPAALADSRDAPLLVVVFLICNETLDRLTKYEIQHENADHQRSEENQQAQPERVTDHARKQKCERERTPVGRRLTIGVLV
jgi:hypothetical protein